MKLNYVPTESGHQIWIVIVLCQKHLKTLQIYVLIEIAIYRNKTINLIFLRNQKHKFQLKIN